MEFIRLVLPAGKEIARHSAPGEITVQCLEGQITFNTDFASREMTAGDLIYLSAKTPHSLNATENSSVLVTLLSEERPK